MTQLITRSTIFTRPANTDAYAAGDSVAPVALSVEGASNASPIVITSTAHGLVTGDRVTIASVGGNTAANGNWKITKIDADSFSLDGSTGNGGYTSGGTILRLLRLLNVASQTPPNGLRGLIVKTRLECDTATITNGTFRVYFFTQQIAQIADNAAWVLLFADRAKRAGFTADLVLKSEGSGSDGASAQDIQSVIPFELASGETDLFAVIVAEGAYAPESGEQFYLEITVEV